MRSLLAICTSLPLLFPMVAAAQTAVPTAYLDVSVVDRFGAPLEGVAVRLDGVVRREVATNAIGAAAFDDLPDGRYELNAGTRDLVSFRPQIADLVGPGGKSVTFTLKPIGVSSAGNACGGYDSSSLQTL